MANVSVRIPNIGTSDAVEIIEILVVAQDKVEEGQSIIVLESDKASMEIPSPVGGEISEIKAKLGDKVTEGVEIMTINQTETSAVASKESAPAATPAVASKEPAPAAAPAMETKESLTAATLEAQSSFLADGGEGRGGNFYAGPAVRKMARELGVSLDQIQGSGADKRILKEDIKRFVKERMVQGGKSSFVQSSMDFAKFGRIEEREMTKIQVLTAENMHHAWTSVPHVTQFEEIDITDLETFRQGQKALAAQKGVKLTPVPFLIKALALALKELPQFNVSLQGRTLINKHYYHIGMAVDTPFGLVVPVIRDVEKKSIWDLAAETGEMATKARARRLKPDDMQGGCITLSSLGAQGGTQFTPIINVPEVAILGVSRSYHKPIYQQQEFIPRLVLPIALSYDHRAINGVDGAKFTVYLAYLLSDIRNLAL